MTATNCCYHCNLLACRNCGGATLDLQAGTYLLTAPLVLPAGGNIRVTGGTLRAAAAFPRDRWLIESNVDCLWHCTPGVDCMFWNTSVLCHEDVTIENVYFDAGHVASGGLLLNNSMGCVISQCYFIGFVRAGIRIQGGHEMVRDNRSWGVIAADFCLDLFSLRVHERARFEIRLLHVHVDQVTKVHGSC